MTSAFTGTCMRIWNAQVTRCILLGLVLMLALINIYGLSILPIGPFQPEKFGTVAEWFGGLGTIATVAIAAITLRHDREKVAREHLRLEYDRAEQQRERERAEASARQEAASRVYAWVEVTRDPITDAAISARFVLENNTSVPVYAWKAKLEGIDDYEATSADMGPILPGHNERVLPQSLQRDATSRGAPRRVAIAFVGENGERMRRRFDGSLEVATRG